jgi:DNA-binding CsgD family transcriptional regulator
MPTVRKLSGKQFGSKIKRLFELIEVIPNWEDYISDTSKIIIKTLYANKNMTQTLEELNIQYPKARAHIVRAIDRIENCKVDHLRQGLSQQAQELFKLMEDPDWRLCLTSNEVLLAEKFKECKNFYQVARELNLTPGNIAATLYGSTQKIGVINKIKQFKAKIPS